MAACIGTRLIKGLKRVMVAGGMLFSMKREGARTGQGGELFHLTRLVTRACYIDAKN